MHERMLTDGFYAEVTLSYDAAIALEKGGRPFAIDSLRAIQLSKADVLDTLMRGRHVFTTKEWKRLLLRSIGLEPAAMSNRAQLVGIVRMVPFVERNYNLVELGPRGTGKKPPIPTDFSLCASDLRWQGDRGENVREQCNRPERVGVPIRRRLLR